MSTFHQEHLDQLRAHFESLQNTVASIESSNKAARAIAADEKSIQDSKNWKDHCIDFLLKNLFKADLTLFDVQRAQDKSTVDSKDQYWRTLSAIVTSVVIQKQPAFCLSLGECIVSFLCTPLEIAYPRNVELCDHITADVLDGSFVLRSQSNSQESRVVLSQPCLPNDPKLLPYKISFNIEFLKTCTAVGYHGGFHWGSNTLHHGRRDGHRALEEGANVTVVDCYLEKNWAKASAKFRVYGASGRSPGRMIPKLGKSFEQLNGKKWEITMDKGNVCSFYHDGVLIDDKFTAVGVGGYIGFWVYHGGAMKVNDIRVELL